MTKTLIITEKPSVARDIVAALGGFRSVSGGAFWESDRYLCTFAVGHILTLPAPEDIDPALKSWQLKTLPILPTEFRLKPIPAHEKRISIIESLITRPDVNCLINACDSAREGELIFREIVQYLHAKQWVQRLWLQSMTPEAIRLGFAFLRDGTDFDGLAAAASCRAQSDWLIGMNATRAFSLKMRGVGQWPTRGSERTRSVPWSVGRVQTPTLALLVRRELEIQKHVPKPFFKLQARFFRASHNQSVAHVYEGTWFDPLFKKSDLTDDERDDRILTAVRLQEITEAIVTAEAKGQLALASEKREQSLRHAPYLFNLTALQKYMASRYKWSAQRTLEAAQRCYEAHKVLTYPRTSSSALPSNYTGEVDRLIKSLSEHDSYGESATFLLRHGRRNDKRTFDDKAVSDHFAIIPTGKMKDLSGDDGRLFDVVIRRFLGNFFPPAVYDKVRRTTIHGGQHFRTGPIETLVEPGWLMVHGREAAPEKEAGESLEAKLPALVAGQSKAANVPVKLQKNGDKSFQDGLKIKEEMTKPPVRINEAKLLSLMEHAGRQVDDEELAVALMSADGLGTAATRADIIQNLKTKEYVDADLRPTPKGISLITTLDHLKAHRLTSAELTGRLELELAEVEKGQRSARTFMQSVVEYTKEVVAAAKTLDTHPVRAAITARQERAGARTHPREDAPNGSETAADDPLGACPLHPGTGCMVIETRNSYMCTSKLEAWRAGEKESPGISLPKTLCQRPITRLEAQAYLQGTTNELQGFISKQGKPFAAKLALTPSGRPSFVFPERQAARSESRESGASPKKNGYRFRKGKSEKRP
jgi:DNA topoisomerase-3